MGILESIAESARNFIKNSVFNQGQEMIYRARLEMWRFQKRLIKGIISAAILLMALVVLALALVFCIIDYLNLGRTLAFLIVGVILLIVGIILKI